MDGNELSDGEMPYEIITPDPIGRWIKKHLNRELIRRLDKRIEKLETAPDVYGKPLREPLSGLWEIYFERRFRVYYRIDYQQKKVYLIAIRHKDEQL